MLKIPRMFHRIWLGGKPMPEEFAQFGRGWMQLNPGWIIRTWTDSDLKCGILALRTGRLIDDARNYSQASDVLRHEILFEFGGVYLDTDFEALKPLEPYLQDASWVGAGEYPGMVSAGFIGCVPNHPIEATILSMLPGRLRGNLPQNKATGPGLVTEAWRLMDGQPSIVRHGPELFYPYPWEDRKTRRWEKFPEAVAAHHWAHSWG
jgi:mannosyltransferase OCH1-like enzyme